MSALQTLPPASPRVGLGPRISSCGVTAPVFRSPLFDLMMAPKHKSGDAGSSDTPRRSRSCLLWLKQGVQEETCPAWGPGTPWGLRDVSPVGWEPLSFLKAQKRLHNVRGKIETANLCITFIIQI